MHDKIFKGQNGKDELNIADLNVRAYYDSAFSFFSNILLAYQSSSLDNDNTTCHNHHCPYENKLNCCLDIHL